MAGTCVGLHRCYQERRNLARKSFREVGFRVVFKIDLDLFICILGYHMPPERIHFRGIEPGNRLYTPHVRNTGR